MSKKKNTLKDLDEFLKQQAATLVPPAKLSEKIEPVVNTQPVTKADAEKEVSVHNILEDLKELSKKEGTHFRQKFYDLIIQSLEAQQQSLPEDMMLINTALYLKSGEQWKEAIREYWRNKK
jgi:hypothetical protein